MEGTPNRENQPELKARATAAAVIDVKGIASGQRVKQSTQVSRYVYPLEGGRGPTISVTYLVKTSIGCRKDRQQNNCVPM